VDDYDGILIFSGLKYSTYKIFDTFWFISFDVDQNIKKIKTPYTFHATIDWIHAKLENDAFGLFV
jgi:hypothetical protein